MVWPPPSGLPSFLGQRMLAQVLIELHAHRVVFVGHDGDELGDGRPQRPGVVGAQIARQAELKVVVDLSAAVAATRRSSRTDSSPSMRLPDSRSNSAAR